MQLHPIRELGLSMRSYHALRREGYETIYDIVWLNKTDISRIRSLGKKSVAEIIEKRDAWIRDSLQESVESREEADRRRQWMEDIRERLRPVLRDVRMLSAELCDGLMERFPNVTDPAVRETLLLPDVQLGLLAFWKRNMPDGIMRAEEVNAFLSSLSFSFDVQILIDVSVESGILEYYMGHYVFPRETVTEVCARAVPVNDRNLDILKMKLKGRALREIAGQYGLTKERIRVIAIASAKKLPLPFEAYYRAPYEFFKLGEDVFRDAFPEISAEGYRYLSLTSKQGRFLLSPENLDMYSGTWNERLREYLKNRDPNPVFKGRLRKQMVLMEMLEENGKDPIPVKELRMRLAKYITDKEYPMDCLLLATSTINDRLRVSPHVLFNRENGVRYYPGDPERFWDEADLSRYKDSVISANLIFRDYRELMKEMDIRDGHELFCLMKTSYKKESSPPIWFRRNPILIVGEADEEEQALRLLKELSPVAIAEYYKEYERRFGEEVTVLQGNPHVAGVLRKFRRGREYIYNPVLAGDRVPADNYGTLRQEATC